MSVARWLCVACLLGATVSCISSRSDYAPLGEIAPGDDEAKVIRLLGRPDSKASGTWNGVAFDMDYTTWFYMNRGRVVFRATGEVHRSEDDSSEDGRPN